MPDKKTPEPKPLFRQRSTWMGAIMIAIFVVGGAIGRTDPVVAAAGAVAGLAVIFLRLSIADAQAIAMEAIKSSRRFVLPFLLAVSLAACSIPKHPDTRPTLKKLDGVLEKLRADYDPSRIRFADADEDEDNVLLCASRRQVIDEARATIAAALAPPVEKAPAKEGDK